MANHKSAAKRARQTEQKTEFKARTKSTVRTFEKKLKKAITESKKDDAQKFLREYSSKIGKAAQKGIYHANTAARKISRLAQQVSRLG